MTGLDRIWICDHLGNHGGRDVEYVRADLMKADIARLTSLVSASEQERYQKCAELLAEVTRLTAERKQLAEALETAEAAAFSAGFEAGERAEREACAILLSERVDTLDDAIKRSGRKRHTSHPLMAALIELHNIAAAIRKRGED